MVYKKLKDLFITKRSSILCVLMVALLLITNIPVSTISADDDVTNDSENEVVYINSLEKEISNTNNKKYKLSVSFKDDEKIVLGTNIVAKEITKDSNNYNGYLSRAKGLIDVTSYSYKFYSLSIENEEEKLALESETFKIENLDGGNSKIIILNDKDKWLNSNEFEINLNNDPVLVFVDEKKIEEEKNDYEIFVEYKKDSDVIGTLNVAKLNNKDDKYNKYFKDDYINVSDKFVKYIDLFELNITKDKDKEQEEFKANVKIKINNEEIDLDKVGIVKINDKNIELVESEINDKEISFTLTEETVFALVELEDEKTLTYRDSDYLITVEYNGLANIDYDAKLKVSEINEKDDQYEDVVEKSSETLGEENVEKADFVRAFDIAIINPKTNEEYEPNNYVKVTIDLLNETISEDNDVSVVHIKDEDNTEVLEAEVVDGAVEFNSSSFSIYVVVSHTISQILTASDGKDYLITVEYDETAGIPEDVELVVSELKKGDKGYSSYVKAAAKKLGGSVNDLEFVRAFDISLKNPKTDEKYQPDNNVKVSIKLLNEDLNNYKNIDVVHFVDKANGDAQIMDTNINKEAVEFKTDGFSVYVLTGSNDEALNPQCTFTFWVPDADNLGYYKEYSFKDSQGHTIYSQIVTNGNELVIPQLSSTDEGTFAGWYEGKIEGGVLVLEEEPFDFNNIIITENSAIDVYGVFQNYVTVYFHNQFDADSEIFPIAYTRRAKLEGTTASVKISDLSSRYVSGGSEELAFNGWSKTPITTPGSATDDNGNPVKALVADEDGYIEVTGEINLYPIFVETHLLSFYAAPTGQGAAYNGPQYLNNGEYLLSLPTSSLSGYTFTGWFTGSKKDNVSNPGPGEDIVYGRKIANADGSLIVGADDAGVYVSDGKLYLRADTTLYAGWTKDTTASYKILYWQQNGNSNSYTYVDYLTKTGTIGEIASVANADKKDSRYPGFHLKEEPESAEINADGSTALHVYYDHNDGYEPVVGIYTLTFADSITEEGKTSGDLPKTIEDVAYNSEITAIANPTSGRKGYAFSKWYLDPYGTKEANLNTMTMPDHDLTLYAGWEVEWYVVSIDPNYGELRPLNDQGVPTGTGSTYFWQTIEREPVAEYTYVERNYVESSSGTFYYVYHPGDGQGNTEWPDRYTYYTTDISKATEDTTFEYSPGIYTYAGWYEVLEDGTEVPYVFGERTDHNTLLRLHWKKNGVYYLKYNAVVNGLDGTMDDADESTELFADGIFADCAEITINHSAIAPTDYTFVGWKVRGSDSGVIYRYGQVFALSADDAERISGKDIVYLDAVYTKVDTASIIYNANGGTITSANVDFGKVPGSEVDTWVDASGVVNETLGTVIVSGLANNSKVMLSNGNGFNAPANSNSTFLGWSDKNVCDNTATFYESGDTIYGVNSKEPRTLYAVWGSKVTFYHNDNAEWGDAWDPTIYTFEDDTYSLIIKNGNVVNEPTDIPVYTGADGRLFRYWATRSGSGTDLDPYVYTEYDFSNPVEGKLDLYACWSLANIIEVHAIDASSATLIEKTGTTGWTTTNVKVKTEATELNGTSHVETPENYEFVFVAVAKNRDSIDENNAVSEIIYEDKEVKVKYEKEDTFVALEDGEELYFVYYQNRALNIGYKSMATSGVLENVTTKAGAPTTTGDSLLGEYDMTSGVLEPLSLVSGDFTNYAFAIGSVDPGTDMNASNLSLITDAKGDSDENPVLKIRNTYRGFQYTTDEIEWANCGYDIQLYVIYYTQTPTVVLFQEKTVGTSSLMDTPFTFDLLVTQTTKTITSVQKQTRIEGGDWENSGDPVISETTSEPEVIYDTTAEGNQPYILRNGETNSAILFYNSLENTAAPVEIDNYTQTVTTTTIITAQSAVITQTENIDFTTKVKADGSAEVETLSYACSADGTGGTNHVTFTNSHKAHTIEVHVALVEGDEYGSGVFQRDSTFRNELVNSFQVSLGTSESILTKLPSAQLFTGDLSVYALGVIASGVETIGNEVRVKYSGFESIAYEQVDDNIYELVLKDNKGETIAHLGNDRLYYVYYLMPQIRYVKEEADGTLSDITGCLINPITGDIEPSEFITYGHNTITMNGMAVAQNQSFEIPMSGFIISQSGNHFRIPPVLDNGLYERYLSYTKIGAGNGAATNISELDVGSELAMQLRVSNNTLEYNLGDGTWKSLSMSGIPTIYAIYSERGYDLQIGKMVDMSVSGQNPLFSGANFDVTISSLAITKSSYSVDGAEGSEISAVPAVGDVPGTISLSVSDGTKIKIKGLGLGEYTITEYGNENYDLSAKAGPIVGNTTSNIPVIDNTTVILTLDSEKRLDLINSPKAICRIGDQNFYTLRSMIAYVDENIANKTATAEMLTDYLMPIEDTVDIPSQFKIALTTADSVGRVAVITRRPELAGTPLFTCEGALTLTELLLEGNSLAATAPMISSSGDVTIGSGTTVQNVIGASAIKATAGNITVSGVIQDCSADEGAAIYQSGNSVITLEGTGTIQNNTATSGNGGAIWLSGGMVNISGTSKIEGNKAINGNGGAIYSENIVEINIDQGGSITNNTAKAGGAIYANDNGRIIISETENVEVKPTITGNIATSDNGGAIYINKGSVSVSGGNISGNAAENGLGGAIYSDKASVTISSTAEVKANNAKEGGAAYLESGAATISGGTVENNNATTGDGGAIYTGSGNVTVSGGDVIRNNATAGSGAAIYTGSGNVTITGGNLSLNIANVNGGAVYAEEGSISVFVPEGETAATIANNTATTGDGGALYSKKGAILITETTFTSNTAGNNGGAVYADSGSVTITDSIFGGDTASDGNSATADGGAIYAGSGNVTITDGSLKNNKSTAGNGGAIYAGSGVIALSTVELTSNTANSNGGAIYLDSGSMTLTTVTATSNNAINGSAIFSETGRVSFSAGSYTENTASNGGAVGVGDSDARLVFAGDVQIKNNNLTGSTVKSNVYLDQDDDAVINIDSLGTNASVGIYVADDVLDTRGVPGARFANYTSNTNAAKVVNDRHPALTIQSDTAAKKFYWGNSIKVSVYRLDTYDLSFSQPAAAGAGTMITNGKIDAYYPELSEATISELANEIVNKKSLDVGTNIYAAAYIDGVQGFGDYITKLRWDSDLSQWIVTKRNGEEISMTKGPKEFRRIYIYYAQPAYLSIENNTDMTLNITDMKVNNINVINSTSVAGYGTTFAKNGAIRSGLLPVSVSDMTLAAGQSITLLFPCGRDKSYSLDGNFVTSVGGGARLRRTGEVESTLTYSATGDFDEITGTTLNSNSTYQIILGTDKNICKVKDASGVEHPYSKISDAIAAIKNGTITLATANTAVVEMLVDYLLPASDHVLIPRGYDITLTTAVKAGTEEAEGVTYTYQGESTDGRAIISRDLENTKSMIDAWNSAWNPSTGTGTDNINKLDNTTLRLSNLVIDGKSVKGNSDGGAVASKYVNVYVNHVDFKNVVANNGGAMLIMFSATDKNNKKTVPETILEVNNSNFTGCTSTKTGSNRLGGGAIVTNAETMNIDNCRFDTCKAEDQAGAVFHRVDADYDSWTNVSNCVFTNCTANAAGGLELDSKTILVTNTTFEHCVAKQRNGGGFNVWSLNSGSINIDCWVTVRGCTFNDCQVTTTRSDGGNGGGFRSTALYTTVENSTFTNNTGYYGGGFAVSNTNAKKVEIYGSSFERNTANLGGGMRLLAKEVIIGDYTYTDAQGEHVRHTEIKNCTSNKENGGGILHDKDVSGSTLTINNAIINGNEVKTANMNGGGVYTKARAVEINGTTISDNVATNLGGGLYAYSYTLKINDSNISRNTANSNGGGVWFDIDSDTNRGKQNLIIKGSSIDGNTSNNGNGGGVYTLAKTVTIGASETKTDTSGKPVYSSISNNTTKLNGGGIYQKLNVAGSALTITNANINNNTANNTANKTEDAGGGGVYAGVRTLKITKSNITSNTAKANGGGVLFDINDEDTRNAMSLTVEGSTFNGNASSGNGSGIYTRAKTVAIKKHVDNSGESPVTTTSTISNCSAAWSGGGIYQNRGDVEGSKLEISNTTVSGCTSNDTSTDTNPPRGGGGVFANVRNVTVSDSTISNNTAVRNGGGIDAPMNGTDYALVLDKVTISGNSAGYQGGGVYTRSQLTLRNDTEITSNHLTTNTEANCAGVYLVNERTLFIGPEDAIEGQSDKIIVRNNTTANGTLSDLRLWDDGTENDTDSVYVYCNLSNDSEIRVVNAAKAGTQFGSAKYALTNGFSDDNYVFIADNSTLHGITDRGDPENKKIIWAGPPVAKLTDGNGRLLYIKYYEGVGTYPAIFDRLDTGAYEEGSTVSPFSMLRMDTLTLYYRDGTTYEGNDFCIKMLVERYETAADLTVTYKEGRTVTFTTAEKSFPSDWAYTDIDKDVYHFEGRSGDRATVIRGKAVASTRSLMNVEGTLKIENIIIDGGKENGITLSNYTRCLYINSSNGIVTLGENAILQNGKLTGNKDGAGALLEAGSKLNIEGGIIRNCYAHDGGGIFLLNSSATLKAGSIYQCEASGSGGGVRIKDGGTFTMTGGTIQNCSANNGGGVYVAGGRTMYMSGGSIIKNSATSAGGGIATYNKDSRLYFSGKVNVSGNTSGTGNNVKKCNVELSFDSYNIINTYGGGLYPGSYIGVYVPGDEGTNSNYDKHGVERKPFGTFTEGDSTTNFYSFVNDRNGLKGGIIEESDPNYVQGKNCIYWIKIFSLEITNKVVSGASTTINPDELFLYKVNVRGNATATGQQNAAQIDSTTGDYGEMWFTSNGKDTTTAVFGLVHDQTITGVNLSQGLTYEVIEYLTLDQYKRYAAMPMNATDSYVETLTYEGVDYQVIKVNSFTSTIGENKERSDVDPYTSAITFSNMMPICKITDMNGNILYQKYNWEKTTYRAGEGKDGGSVPIDEQPYYYAPAVYTELTGEDGAFAALEGTLYTSNDSYPTSYSVDNGVKIQMLVGSYNLNSAIDVDTGKVTLTTAAATDGLFPKQDAGTSATIRRLFTGDSMFTVDTELTLATIILDGAKGSYSINSNGGIVNVKDGKKLTIQNGATLQNSKIVGEYKGGAVYVGAGATVYMTGGTINHNESVGDGAGIYLNENSLLYISGAPSFGGTGTNVSGNISTANGNFKVGSLVAQLNGGKSYTRARQDIYIAGYAGEDGDKSAASLVVDGNISSGDGTIWVWVQDTPHYKYLQQFAKIKSGVDVSIESLRAFRNARPDNDTSVGNIGHYLFGIKKADDVTGLNVFWSGSRHITLRKSTESPNYQALSGARFDIYLNPSTSTYAVDNNGNTLSGLMSDSNGIFYVGELSYGTYYAKETTAPNGYSKPINGYYFIITVDETGVGYKYKEGGEDKIRRDVSPKLPS